ncbi:DNA repair protein complementing XP-C cells homolog isoform X2 [Lytechinus variegatus]|uniref:DNA repair protein complementing XP-C cells homolog isoform X2 n=1 Tax=Lytechinus variegatus TaxID=7654 RepID=UPI001BB2023B|nr:DNA repair protein complementing XP-C cells homolog isoform X2 [Lytechinus variegatus]
MAKRKVSGPVKTSSELSRKTNSEPILKVRGQVKSRVKTNEKDTKVKERSKVKDSQNTLSQDERVAPVEISQNGPRRGRSAKLQAVKKMSTMQEDAKRTEGIEENESEDDDDYVSLDSEYDDEEDEDDFEATPSLQKRTSNTRQKNHGKMKSKDKSKQVTKEHTAVPVRQSEKIFEERYVCQASQEQFLSLSDSDSSSEDESDLGESKPSSLKTIPDKSEIRSATSQISKLKEMKTDGTDSSLVLPSQPTTKSMFDDLDDIPDFQGSQPGNNKSLFDDVEVEDNQKESIPRVEKTDVKSVIRSQYFEDDELGGAHEEVSPQEKEADVKPMVTSQYFDDVDLDSDHGKLTPRKKNVAKPVVTSPVVTSDYFDECSSPDSKHLSKIKNLRKRRLRVSDARSVVKSTTFNESDILEKDESDFEESPPEKAKKQLKKRIAKVEQASSEEKKNEKQTKKDVKTNILPTSNTAKKPVVMLERITAKKPVVMLESRKGGFKGGHPDVKNGCTRGKNATISKERKNEKQSKKDVDPKVLPAMSKTRDSTKSHSNASKNPVIKAESGRRDKKGGQRDAADDVTRGKKTTIREEKSEKQRKKNSNASVLPAESEKSGNTKSHPNTSNRSVVNSDNARGLTQGQSDREGSTKNLTKKRKLSTGVKNSSMGTVKKDVRGDGDGGSEHSSPAKKRKMSTRSKSSSADTVKRAGREASKRKMATKKEEKKMEIEVKEEDADISSDESEWEEVEDTPINEIGEPMLTPSPKKANDQEVSLEIDIDLPGKSQAGKKKKREYNWANYFQWQVNKYNKERQLLLHKSHLVLLLTSSFHSNKICNQIELQCLALSIIPSELVSKRPKQLNINYLTKILGWFKNSFKIKSDLKEDLTASLERILPLMFEKRQAASERQLVHMFAIILRCLGVDVRLIFSLQPLTFKAKKLTKKFKRENANAPVKKPSGQNTMQERNEVPQEQLSSTDISSPAKSAESTKKLSSSSSSSSTPKTQSTNTTLLKSKQQSTKSSSSRSSTSTSLTWSPSKAGLMPSKSLSHSSSSTSSTKIRSMPSGTKADSSKSGQPSSKGSLKKSSANAPKTQITSTKQEATSSKSVEKMGKVPRGKVIKEEKTATKKKPEGSVGLNMSGNLGKKGREKQEPTSERHAPKRSLRAKNTSRRRTASKMTPQYDERDDEEGESDDDHSDYEEELRKSVSKRKSRAPSASGSTKKKAKMSSSVSTMEEVSSDDDFEVKVMSVTKQPRKAETAKNENKKKVSRKVLSSDSDESILLVDILDPGSDLWLEVYLSSEKRWICVDCVRALINKPEMCEKKATEPITYVIGVENDGCVKDITRRYASKWMTETHKLRPVDEWWEETLKPYQSNKDRDRKEDLDVQSNLTSKPLPTSVAEYKNHPLYALKRHLLKFEALYPESAAVIGYCKGEAVYSRECVHTLHTRETWMKEGKAIRINEKPYKMVKPRPKWKKGIGMIKTEESTLGIFGEWQVEDYIPPPAVDGKVPRNEYGNVELFKPTMLPAGTVHLKIAGLNKIARKLDIDCAPAMMGWDFHSGYIHPVMDGFVVCEEHAEVLVAAWEEDRAEQEKKEKEKREARAMNHWKLFIKSLLIRERLKERYGKNDPNLDSPSTSQQSEKDGRKDTSPVKASWPENKMTAFTGDEGNLLPFEKKISKKKKKR